ncbi:hypothetical protein BaRGS_00022679 [Batillaria attramentaria]|uniref:Uncharacterized protein n=1 Tax=Batillaria attramentaria TaxID=370345 RepID=A0ABD0KGI7_9CAEN
MFTRGWPSDFSNRRLTHLTRPSKRNLATQWPDYCLVSTEFVLVFYFRAVGQRQAVDPERRTTGRRVFDQLSESGISAIISVRPTMVPRNRGERHAV